MSERAATLLEDNDPSHLVVFEKGGTELQHRIIELAKEHPNWPVGKVAHIAGVETDNGSASINYTRDVLRSANDIVVKDVVTNSTRATQPAD